MMAWDHYSHPLLAHLQHSWLRAGFLHATARPLWDMHPASGVQGSSWSELMTKNIKSHSQERRRRGLRRSSSSEPACSHSSRECVSVSAALWLDNIRNFRCSISSVFSWDTGVQDSQSLTTHATQEGTPAASHCCHGDWIWSCKPTPGGGST